MFLKHPGVVEMLINRLCSFLFILVSYLFSGCGAAAIGVIAATSGGSSSGAAVRTNNSSPSVSAALVSTQDGTAVGTVVLNLSLQDAESDDVDLLVTVTAPGFNSGQPFIISGTDALDNTFVSNLSASPGETGSPHVLLWDSEKTVGRTNLPNMILTVTPTDKFASNPLEGAAFTTNSFNLNNNNQPVLTLVSSPTSDDNVVPLVFQVSDQDPSDQLFVTSARFTNLQSGAIATATPSPNSPVQAVADINNPNPSLALTQNTDLVFQWDSRKDLGFGNGSLILFELTISDGSNFVTKQFSPPFFINNGPFEATQTVNTTLDSISAAIADADGDGSIDLALSMAGNGSDGPEIQIYTNNGTLTFTKNTASFGAGTNAAPGPLAVIPFLDNTVANPVTQPSIFAIDLADTLNRGLVVTTKGPNGFLTPKTLVTDAALQAPVLALGAPFTGTRVRCKVMNRGDFSATPDGLEDLILLVRNGNEDGSQAADGGTGEGTILFLEQNANGGFNPPQVILPASLNFGQIMTTNVDTVDFQPGDFNIKDAEGDGDLDLIVAETGTQMIRVYSKESGTTTMMLRASIDVTTPGKSLISAEFGDINGDNREDVVALLNSANESTIMVFLANSEPMANFGFEQTPTRTLTVARRIDDLRAINLTFPTDGDNRDDLFIGDETTTNIGVFISDPSFPSGFLESQGQVQEVTFPAGGQVRDIQIGDFNNDGVADIAAAARFSNVPILVASVPRLYLDATPVSIQNSAVTIAIADILPGDNNREEVITIDSASQDLLVLGFDSVLTLALRKLGPFRANLKVKGIDVDQDGQSDDIIYTSPDASGLFVGIALVPSGSSELDIRSQRSDPFLEPAQFASSPAFSSAIGNTTFFNGGTRFVEFRKEIGNERGLSSIFANAVAFGDVGRGDDGQGGPLTPAGLPDIVISPAIGVVGNPNNQGVFVLYQKADGSFTDAIQILGPVGNPGRSGTFGNSVGGYVDINLFDLNGNGQLSILCTPIEDDNPPDVTGAEQNHIAMLDQNADGIGLTAFFDFDPGNAGNGAPLVSLGILASDLNGDGFKDVLIANNLGPTLNVLINRGPPGLRNGGLSATFQPTFELFSNPRCVQAVLGDIDGDGDVDDVAMATLGTGGKVMVYTGNGDGSFSTQRQLDAPEPFWIAVGDVNGDGQTDIVSTDRGSGNLRVFLHK